MQPCAKGAALGQPRFVPHDAVSHSWSQDDVGLKEAMHGLASRLRCDQARKGESELRNVRTTGGR